MQERVRQKGVLSLWRGLSASLAKDSSFGCVFMGSYDMLRKRLVGNETSWKQFFNGAAAHVITWGMLMPVDFVKTGVQRSEAPISPAACIRAIPVSGFGMLAYEAAKSCVF